MAESKRGCISHLMLRNKSPQNLAENNEHLSHYSWGRASGQGWVLWLRVHEASVQPGVSPEGPTGGQSASRLTHGRLAEEAPHGLWDWGPQPLTGCRLRVSLSAFLWIFPQGSSPGEQARQRPVCGYPDPRGDIRSLLLSSSSQASH